LEGGVYESRQVDARGMGLVNKYMLEDGEHIFGARDGVGHAAEFP
jgi:hypothetical protein